MSVLRLLFVVDREDDVAVGAAVFDLVLGGVGHVKAGGEGLAARAVLADIQGRHATVLAWLTLIQIRSLELSQEYVNVKLNFIEST